MSTNNYIRFKNLKSQQPRTDMFGNKVRVPFDRVDEEAELKFTGGYNVRRSNRCDKCFEYRSTNGKCSCE
jgi:hypothetical protein